VNFLDFAFELGEPGLRSYAGKGAHVDWHPMMIVRGCDLTQSRRGEYAPPAQQFIREKAANAA